MTHTSSENIAEALKLLEEAAKLKKEELKTAMSDKYANLKTLIVETESSLLNSLHTAKEHAVHSVVHAKDAGLHKASEIGHDVDKKVHQNPWPFIAGSAVVGLLFGSILARGNHR